MKFILLLLLSIPAYAAQPLWPLTAKILTSSPSSAGPTLAFPSAPLAGIFLSQPQIHAPNQLVTVQIDNNTPDEIEVNCSGASWPVPNNGHGIYIGGSTTWSTPTGINQVGLPLGQNCYIRSSGGISAYGTIRISGWGY